jgi:flagellar basal-body rod protein FlgB
MNLSNISLFSMLSDRMAWLTKRQQVLSHNIANANTPGFVPKDLAPVDFKRMAEHASGSISISATNGSHLSGSSRSSDAFRAVEPKGDAEMTPSGNAVVLEEELMKVSETVMDHQIMANLYSKHINMIRTVLGRTG